MAQQKQIRLGTMRLWVRSLASLSGLRIRRCCELGSGIAWLWCRPAAVTPIRPLAWEPLYAACVALKKKTKDKKNGFKMQSEARFRDCATAKC